MATPLFLPSEFGLLKIDGICKSDNVLHSHENTPSICHKKKEILCKLRCSVHLITSLFKINRYLLRTTKCRWVDIHTLTVTHGSGSECRVRWEAWISSSGVALLGRCIALFPPSVPDGHGSFFPMLHLTEEVWLTLRTPQELQALQCACGLNKHSC